MNVLLFRRALNRLSLLAWFVTAAIGVAGQTANSSRPYDESKTVSYGFVSPNTREGLKLEEAVKNLSSQEESNLIRKSSLLGCRLRTSIQTRRALGSWSDGAEHSVLLRMAGDERAIRYIVSSLGRDAQQKTVLYFRRRRDGPARLYVIYPTARMRRISTLSTILDHAGINFRTLVPLRRTTLIYVVDDKRELQSKLRTVRNRLNAKIFSQSGNAEFIGDNSDREKAVEVFTNEITTYESAHPRLPATCKDRSKIRSTHQ